MLGDNSLGANSIDGCVPDIIGVNDNHWTVSALIHAAGVIHSDDIANTCGGHGFLENSVNLYGPGKRTSFTTRAHEDVMTVLTHSLTYPVPGHRSPLADIR